MKEIKMNRWDFFHRTESARPVVKEYTFYFDTTDPAEALKLAKESGLPKGSQRRGCFEIQGEAGIWQQVDEKRLDFTQLHKINFMTWEGEVSRLA